MKTKKIWLKWLAISLAALLLLGIGGIFGLDAYVVGSVKDRVLTVEQASALTDVDCILVLGCGVRDDGTPSAMLRDRLIQGITLYKAGAAPKLLMSGDHGRTDYDEVNVMKQYAMDACTCS